MALSAICANAEQLFLRGPIASSEITDTNQNIYLPQDLGEPYVNRFGNKERIILQSQNKSEFHKLIEV